jgi:hypothetical protein
MGIVFLLLLLLLSMSLFIHAKDLGELSANPAGLSGSFRFFGLFGSFGFFGFPISQPNERDKLDKSVLVSLNQTDQMKLPAASCGVSCKILRSHYPPLPRLRRVPLAFIPVARYGVFGEGE